MDAPALKPYRIWPLIIIAILMFALRLLPKFFEDPPEMIWMTSILGPLVGCLLILICWLTVSRALIREKLIGLAGVVVSLILTIILVDPTMKGPGIMMLTIPMGFVAFVFGIFAVSRWLSPRRIFAVIALCGLSFGFSILLRNEGMWGNGAQEFRWRWTPTAEQKMMAERSRAGEQTSATIAEAELSAVAPEWPGFRGKDRTARQQGTKFSADWSASPPEELWRIEVGPGWSSFAVQGNYLFTQEQRGPDEMVVCYTADSGNEVWTSPVGDRFADPMGGPGPRATPQLADGHLFAQGASGTLVCVNPANGKQIWQTHIGEIADRKPPMWGYSSSPLIVEGNVIVHAGGEGDKGTLAFDSQNGELKWSAPAGDHSYASAHFAQIAGKDYVLMLTNLGLRVLEPKTGEPALFYEWKCSGYRSLQPQVLNDDSVLLPTGVGTGTRRIRLSNSNDGKLSAAEMWTSQRLKSDFNDFVIYRDHAYGFDGGIFTCIDLKTGDRAWKGGRYGKGQVLLLEDSGLLLVLSERGEIVLLKASHEDHEELATLPALHGKTWNHPVVVGDRLFIRNAETAACYRLPTG